MESINIYLDATGFRDFQTGVGRYSYNLITELLKIESRWNFVVLVQRQLSELHPVYALGQTHQNLTVRKINAAAIGPKRDMRFFLSPVRGYHLYHCLNSNLPLAIGRGSVVTVHDIIYCHYPQFLGAFHPLKLMYYNALMRHVAQRAEQIISVSHATANDFACRYSKNEKEREAIGNKTTVIYEGAFATAYENKQHDSKNQKEHFFFIGELRPHKNIDRLIKGFMHFRTSTRGAEKVMLYIAGSPHNSYALPDPLPENVQYCGRVNDQELMNLYRTAIALCFVSCYEGFGLPILEAMRHRVAVITSNVSSMPEVAGDAALLVDPEDSNEIGRAMQRLFVSPKLRLELIDRGVQRVKRFSWQHTAVQTRAIYETILAKQVKE